MSLKSVEMQVAISKSQEASRMQDQMNRQGQQFQATLTEKQLKEEQLKRKQVNKYDNVEKRDVTDENQDKERKKEEQERQRQKEKKQARKLPHPYIGNKIDFTR